MILSHYRKSSLRLWENLCISQCAICLGPRVESLNKRRSGKHRVFPTGKTWGYSKRERKKPYVDIEVKSPRSRLVAEGSVKSLWKFKIFTLCCYDGKHAAEYKRVVSQCDRTRSTRSTQHENHITYGGLVETSVRKLTSWDGNACIHSIWWGLSSKI